MKPSLNCILNSLTNKKIGHYTENDCIVSCIKTYFDSEVKTSTLYQRLRRLLGKNTYGNNK